MKNFHKVKETAEIRYSLDNKRHRIRSIPGSNNKVLTKENFKVLFMKDGIPYVLEAEDFRAYRENGSNDYCFDSGWVDRDTVPNEVREFLDEVIADRIKNNTNL